MNLRSKEEAENECGPADAISPNEIKILLKNIKFGKNDGKNMDSENITQIIQNNKALVESRGEPFSVNNERFSNVTQKVNSFDNEKDNKNKSKK